MTLMNESFERLKMDTGGRVRTSPERREAVPDKFERSGLSGMRFAARYALKYPTFASWVLRRKKQLMLQHPQCFAHDIAFIAIAAGADEPRNELLQGRWQGDGHDGVFPGLGELRSSKDSEVYGTTLRLRPAFKSKERRRS